MICVDSNVAAKWLFEEEFSLEADALYGDALRASEAIIAPPLLPIELANIIRQRMRRQKQPHEQLLSLADARVVLRHFSSFPVELRMPPELHEQALAIAHSHDLPAVYDAHYLALAQMLGCQLWTADEKLVRMLRGHLPFVNWLGDYQPR